MFVLRTLWTYLFYAAGDVPFSTVGIYVGGLFLTFFKLGPSFRTTLLRVKYSQSQVRGSLICQCVSLTLGHKKAGKISGYENLSKSPQFYIPVPHRITVILECNSSFFEFSKA
jgi:hypothetical protein